MGEPFQLTLPFDRRWRIETLKQCITGMKDGHIGRTDIADYLSNVVKMKSGENFYIDMYSGCYRYIFYSTYNTISQRWFNTIESAPPNDLMVK